jgi:hypothetical protein
MICDIHEKFYLSSSGEVGCPDCVEEARKIAMAHLIADHREEYNDTFKLIMGIRSPSWHE